MNRSLGEGETSVRAALNRGDIEARTMSSFSHRTLRQSGSLCLPQQYHRAIIGGTQSMTSITDKGGTGVTSESRPDTWRLNHSVVVAGRLSAVTQVPPFVGNA